MTTNFEHTDNSDIINKAYLDKNIKNIDGHISLLERRNNEFKILGDKQSIEELLFQRAVKTTIHIFYDKGLFDSFPNADGVLKDFLFVIRRRGGLEESNWCYSMILFIIMN